MNINNQTENINKLINNIQSLRDELVQQLENQEVKDIDKNAKIRDLIKRIEDIEGGGGGDYSSFFEYVEEFNRHGNIMKNRTGRDMSGQFPLCPNLKTILFESFGDATFTGEFPLMEKLEHIGSYAFHDSVFTGEFPLFPNLKVIGEGNVGNSFNDSVFTGEFPLLPNLTFIHNSSFLNSVFTGEFPLMENLEYIGDYAFHKSKFTGEFPLLPNLKAIGKLISSTFHNSTFTGEFPLMENLETIGRNVFYSSNFDKDEDGFIKNYPGWDGLATWYKPTSYRTAMKDTDAPKLMSIIPPGAGEIQVLNEEAKLAQGIKRDEYLEENEPSDIDYYISYTKKLKEIGFKRDEYGNYVDMINDKSVIIIPEDIKFLV